MNTVLDYITQDLLGLVCFCLIAGSAVLCLLVLVVSALMPEPNTSTARESAQRNSL